MLREPPRRKIEQLLLEGIMSQIGHGVPPSTHSKLDRKSTRLNSSHGYISYAVFCLKKKNPIPPVVRLVASSDPYPSFRLVAIDRRRVQRPVAPRLIGQPPSADGLSAYVVLAALHRL